MVHVAIIDDEPRSIATLENMLRDYCPDLQVQASARSVKEGITLLEKQQPELLFLDIAMPDGSGFELLEKVPQKQFEVIFTTAFEQYAIKAFDFSAMNYLLKPINPERLQQVVAQYQAAKNDQFQTPRYDILKNALNDEFSRIALPCLDGIQFVELNDIIYCEADSNYCTFFLNDDSKVVVSRSLRSYEQLLADSHFFRLHHKYLVNLRYVKKYIRGSGGYVILENGVHLDVSVRRRDEFLQKIAILTRLR